MSLRAARKISLIAGFSMVSAAIIIGYANPATNFELSIYSSTPLSFWILVGSALLIGTILVFHRGGTGSGVPVLLIGTSFTAIILLPVFRGYKYLREGDPMAHLGWTKGILAGDIFPVDILYPAVHLLSAQMKLVTGLEIKHAIFLSTLAIALLFPIFIPLSVRVVSDKSISPVTGLYAALMYMPLLQTDPLSFSPGLQAYLFTPMVIYLCLQFFRTSRNEYFLLSVLAFTGLTTVHPQQALHFLFAIAAISLYLVVRTWLSGGLFSYSRTFMLFFSSSAIIFWTYINNIDRFAGGVQSYTYQFIQRTPASDVAGSAESASMLGYSFLELFLRVALPDIVFSLFAGALFLSLLIKRERNVQIESLIIGVGILSALFLGLFFLGSGALRLYGFLMIWITILGTLGALRLRELIADHAGQFRQVVHVVVVGLFLFSLLTLFNNPFILLSTGHVMDGYLEGYEKTFEITSHEDPVDFVRSSSYRYYQGVNGLEEPRPTKRIKGFRIGSQAPFHFANRSLHSYYNQTTYLAITSADYERDAIMYDGFRFSKRDFAYLRTAKNINKVYDSNEFRLYHIPQDRQRNVSSSLEVHTIPDDRSGGAPRRVPTTTTRR